MMDQGMVMLCALELRVCNCVDGVSVCGKLLEGLMLTVGAVGKARPFRFGAMSGTRGWYLAPWLDLRRLPWPWGRP